MERGFKFFIDKYTEEGARRIFEDLMTILLKKINNGNAYNVKEHKGDGGVDIYCGDITESPVIYQCKFYVDRLNDSRKEKIKQSLNTALKNHPNLNKWILCIPTDFTHEEHEWWSRLKKNYKINMELYDEKQIILLLKENDLYDEYFDTVRVDREQAIKVFENISKVKASNDNLRKENKESYDDFNGIYSFKSYYINFYGLLPFFPERLAGSCSIEFNRQELKDLSVILNHKHLIELFEIIEGNNTGYLFSDRFKIDNEKVRFFVGNTLLILLKDELKDLICILNKYKLYYIASLKKIISHLEIDKFDSSKTGVLSFRLFEVRIELWKYMKDFANKHDCLNGKSEWHMFHPNDLAINIFSSIISNNQRFDHGMHAYLKTENTDYAGDKYVWLVINMNISKDHTTKLEDYNERNIWGALTTYKWLINEYLPKIEEVYRINNLKDYYSDFVIRERLNIPRERIIENLQYFVMSNKVYISKTEMEWLLQSLIFCLSKKELPIHEYDYILGKLRLRLSIKGVTPQALSKEIIRLLKDWVIEEIVDRNSYADDILRCILTFVHNGTKNRLSEEEFMIVKNNLESLIMKMENINFLKYCAELPID